TRTGLASPQAETGSAANSCGRPARSARAHTKARSHAAAHAAAAAPPHQQTQIAAPAARSPTSRPSQLPSVSSSNDDHQRGHRSPPQERTLQRTNKALLGQAPHVGDVKERLARDREPAAEGRTRGRVLLGDELERFAIEKD